MELAANRLPESEDEDRVYLAGQRVPAGIYRQVGTPREIILETEDYLPASLDGCVACYQHIINRWQQHQRKSSGIISP